MTDLEIKQSFESMNELVEWVKEQEENGNKANAFEELDSILRGWIKYDAFDAELYENKLSARFSGVEKEAMAEAAAIVREVMNNLVRE